MSKPIVDPRIEEYLRRLYDDGDPVRLEMEALGRERRFPIVGPLVGRHLMVLARAIGARRVFELGSGYGYSALHFAQAVGPSGEVHCTDLSEENVRLAEGFLRRAGVWERVTYHREDAATALRRVGGTWDIVYNDIDKEGYPEVLDLAFERLRAGVWERVHYHREEAAAALRRLGGTWDIVYNDIDKQGYPETVDLAFERLREGGLFITDNVLWSGRVLEGGDDGTPATRGVSEFTRRLFAHPGFLTTIDPTRDGVAVALKIAGR